MAKYPNKPEEIFEEYKTELKSIYGNELVSVVLYGSAARGKYVPGKSDINFLVCLTEEGIKDLNKVNQFVKKWQKSKVALPLILTEKYINDSIDSFPVEFFNFQSFYKVVDGKDILRGLEISKKDLRLQLEREFKGKLLNLRQAYFQAVNNKHDAQYLVKDSMGVFVSLFPALLHYLGKEISADPKQVLKTVTTETGLDDKLFDKLLSVKNGETKIKKDETVSVLSEYILQIEKLSEYVDKM